MRVSFRLPRIDTCATFLNEADFPHSESDSLPNQFPEIVLLRGTAHSLALRFPRAQLDVHAVRFFNDIIHDSLCCDVVREGRPLARSFVRKPRLVSTGAETKGTRFAHFKPIALGYRTRSVALCLKTIRNIQNINRTRAPFGLQADLCLALARCKMTLGSWLRVNPKELGTTGRQLEVHVLVGFRGL
jgi:hypothetical protein